MIGDPALRLDPTSLPWHIYDLGSEWKAMTGLPMVYALWSGRWANEAADLFHASWRIGRDNIEEIVLQEALPMGFSPDLARAYLTHHIQFELTGEHERGLALFLQLATELS